VAIAAWEMHRKTITATVNAADHDSTTAELRELFLMEELLLSKGIDYEGLLIFLLFFRLIISL